MGVKFFGQFLLERSMISAGQLLQAVEYQEATNMKFGQYAVSKRYLSREDATSVETAQKYEDLLFGEMAIKMEILSKAQVEEILTLQHNDHIYIGAALVKLGFVPKDILLGELAAFKEDQAEYASGTVILPSGIEHPEFVVDAVSITQKLLARVAKMTAKVGDPYISTDEPQRNFSVVALTFTGDLGERMFLLSADLEASETIATSILGVNVINEPSEMISDSVKEFCNIICGNIIAKLAQRGKKMDMSPPIEADYSNKGYELVRGRQTVCYPFVSTSGDLDLIIL